MNTPIDSNEKEKLRQKSTPSSRGRETTKRLIQSLKNGLMKIEQSQKTKQQRSEQATRTAQALVANLKKNLKQGL